ncbi:MAG: sugar ABC transporter ATP-binding protein [Phycisphaerae bacterium]|jgi:ribose transport system ATP-binding protein|nr:sugar ABC transporter ATP-binding protein [Phycisphaerae bacterium]
MTDTDALLRMEGIVKAFSGVRALDGVDFDVCAGEVHALIGENGAGKSTLMNVLAGRFGDYQGRIIFDGRDVRITHPRQALDMGVAVIYQELSVLENFTVAENIMLGRELVGRWSRRIDRSFIRDEARKIIEHLQFDLDVDEPVAEMSTARQCLVEIASAIGRNVRVLVFDEPTAALGAEDVDKLFTVIGELKDRGLGIVYISHRLAELPRIADRVSVLRDARMVGTRKMADCSMSDLTGMMLGRDLSDIFPARTNQPGELLLEVRGLTEPGVFEDISFDLRAGEILGIAGLVGSGRTEIARAIFGARHASGSVKFKGDLLHRRAPHRSLAAGIGMVQEGRKTFGNITGRTVRENITVSILDKLSGAMAFASPGRIRTNAAEMIDRMAVDPPSGEMSIENLSGGNQQKVIVGRWLAAGPEVLIFDEPTQGIDVGTKKQMYKIIADLAAAGRAIILISSELIELTELADRILIIRNGRLTGERPGGQIEEDQLFELCLGESESE